MSTSTVEPPRPAKVPETLNPRHQIIATLDAAGLTNAEIAERVGMHPARISLIKASPLYVALRTIESRRIRERIVEQAGEVFDPKRAIEARGEDIVKRHLRMAEELETTNPKVALAANRDLLKRVVPERTILDERKELVLRVTVEERDRIVAGLAEEDALDAEATPVGEPDDAA